MDNVEKVIKHLERHGMIGEAHCTRLWKNTVLAVRRRKIERNR